jgi:uncharacterized membrane protein
MHMNTGLEASSPRQSGWLIPAGLIMLSILPLVGGMVRMVDLAVGEPVPGTARFFESPTPIVVHAISSLTYFILGAFQFSTSLRRNKPGWHRKAGYVLIPSGLLCALSGAWMAYFYPPIFGTGTAVSTIRIVVAAAIAAFICMGFAAIRERNVAAHRAWMMRAYALAIAAGTQPITLAPMLVFPKLYGELGYTLGLAAGWLLNLLVAEWLIRRSAPHPLDRDMAEARATLASR